MSPFHGHKQKETKLLLIGKVDRDGTTESVTKVELVVSLSRFFAVVEWPS